jgi:hypothetical protein
LPARTLLLAAVLAGCLPSGDEPGNHDSDLPPPGAPGTLASVWRRSFTTYQAIDDVSGAMTSRTVAGPTSIPNPDGGELEVLVRIDGGDLVTYAWQAGEEAHHAVRQTLESYDGATFLRRDPDGTRTFTLEDGHLTEIGTTQLGTTVLISQATYGAVETFPPAGWPADVLESDLTEATP